MYQETYIDSLSIFLILALVFCSICLMFEFGFRLTRRFASSRISKAISPMATGLASLLAFILAISFSMAASKNDIRKQLVLKEANAVGTAMLRTELLDEPYRSQSYELLSKYVDIRVVEKQSQRKLVVNQVIRESEQIQQELWKIAVNSHHHLSPLQSQLYIDSLNTVFDIHSERVNYSLRGRIPVSIWITLTLLTFLTIALNGVQVGAQGENRLLVAALPFAMSFSLVLTLIIELDRPARSIIEVSQQPLIDLRDSLNNQSQTNNTSL
ncbi:hypothetical protein BIT28_06100 [Photobacterium proteolyticum]|uniref:DUF4239 domain-containing protein n=1 Tax=Photobacterium proteolyticum TaxID=1903952 RepID=A0A1Q9GEE6_9GAMM|nr:hypothetical protein [Photobacterium proteolyticum]OLQ72762.1 hypothetical protein BIT28_06100 [Photobacterium proteolyticum]